MALAAGTRLGPYKILEPLGAGGMGEVYRARDTRLHREVAVKILPRDLAENKDRLRRFEQEARAAGALNHPNILNIHDIGSHEGTPYVVSELLEGETLHECIYGGSLTAQKAIDYAVQVAKGLAAAHAKGIVHRDLKPENLFVTQDGRVKILDFGLAKLRGPQAEAQIQTVSRTSPGAVLGTAGYMSPEQVKGVPVDPRSDIFSFGAVLYEMLSGQQAFRGDSAPETMHAILKHDPPPISIANPAIPRALERIVGRCLEKRPADRFDSVHDLGIALETLASPPPGVPARRPARRWGPRIAGAVGLALLAVGAALYYLLPASPGPSSTWSIRPLTRFTGSETGTTWSPDGSFIAYCHTASGSMDIFVMSAAGGDSIRLTDDPADDVLPRWSPDGRHLAFLSDRGSGTSVYLIPALGGAERKLVETNLPYLERFDDSWGALGAQPWSPDGRELLVSRSQPTGEAAVWKVDLTTGEDTQVTHPRRGQGDLYASWSFDGNWIALVRQQGGAGSLWLVPAEGGEPRVVLDEPYEDTQPAWSSDSRRLVFASNRGGAVGVWEIEVASGQLRQLTTGPWDWYPNVASTGRLAFDRFSDRADLYWTPISGGVEEQLTFNNSDNYAPRYSPDGKKVVFQSNRTGNDEVWLLEVATKAERQLTDHPASDVLPDWSPDAREIAFFSNREGEFQLWVMDAEGGGPRRITEQPLSVPGFACTALRMAPRWSPDGGAIGYVAPGAGGMRLWVVDRDGKNARSYLSGVLRFDWYRDRRHVVYTRVASDGSGAREMRAADLETGQEATLHKGLNVELTVAPDGGAVSYVQAVSHFAQSLYVLPLAPPGSVGGLPGPQGEPSVLSRGTGTWHVHNGGWSPDGTRITYTRTRDESDLYVIENYR